MNIGEFLVGTPVATGNPFAKKAPTPSKKRIRTGKKKGKVGGFIGGQGYCGECVNKDGKNMFLRSANEHAMALMLDRDAKHFDVEQQTFEIDGRNYKPDFFIYSDSTYSNLIEIIEVKESMAEAEEYERDFGKYIRSLGFKYSVVYGCRRLADGMGFGDEMVKWREKSIANNHCVSMAGSNNPKFGMKTSDETKRKIGDQTIRYMKDPEIKARHSKAIKKFWTADAAQEIKGRFRKQRNAEKAERDRIRDETDPIVAKHCPICSEVIFVRTSVENKTCSQSCSTKLAYREGRLSAEADGVKLYQGKCKAMVRRMGKIADFDNWDKSVRKAKELKLIPKNFGFSKKTIQKFFGTFDNFIKECSIG